MTGKTNGMGQILAGFHEWASRLRQLADAMSEPDLMPAEITQLDARITRAANEFAGDVASLYQVLAQKDIHEEFRYFVVRAQERLGAFQNQVNPGGLVMEPAFSGTTLGIQEDIAIAKGYLSRSENGQQRAKDAIEGFLVILKWLLHTQVPPLEEDHYLRFRLDDRLRIRLPHELETLYFDVVSIIYRQFFNSPSILAAKSLGAVLRPLKIFLKVLDLETGIVRDSLTNFTHLLGLARVACKSLLGILLPGKKTPKKGKQAEFEFPSTLVFLKPGCKMCLFFQNSLAYEALEVYAREIPLHLHVTSSLELSTFFQVFEFPSLIHLPSSTLLWCGLTPEGTRGKRPSDEVSWELVRSFEQAFDAVGTFRAYLDQFKETNKPLEVGPRCSVSK